MPACGSYLARNMQRQPWLNVIGVALAVGIHAGCQSPSTEPTAASTPSIMEVVTLPTPATPAFPTDPVVSSARPPVSKHLGPPPWPTNSKSQAWIPFETWTDYNGFGKPRRISSSAQPSYESRSTEGVFGLRIWTHQINWNGLECWLAYAPQIMKGAPYIHALDAEKNLQPLAQPPTTLTKSKRVIVIDPGHGGV